MSPVRQWAAVLFLAGFLGLGPGAIFATDLYVDPKTGNDAADGDAAAPLESIAMAIKRAIAGDTIYLVHHGERWTDLPTFHSKSGEPGKPIVLDGQGAVLDGSEPLDPAQWTDLGDGLFSSDTLLGDAGRAIIDRFYFLIDGRMNRMGRSLKGPKEPWKAPADLVPGEWCWVEETNTFYLRIEAGQALAEAKIALPRKTNGVAISGDCSHLVIRNVTATHVQNDGFNIHGKTRDVRFENVKAIECGDDGISAHGDCWIEIDGMVSTGNSTGVCHVNNSHSIASNLTLFGNHGFEYFVLDTGHHELRDSHIRADAFQSVVINGAREEGGGTCEAIFENVIIEGTGASDVIKANRRSIVTFDRVTVTGGLSMSVAGDAFTLRDSAIVGRDESLPAITVYAHVNWQASGNRYRLSTLRIGDQWYDETRFAEYQRATGQGMGSCWLSADQAGAESSRVLAKSLEAK
ncbi:MAG: right-handed parallel beta-helix repeat-containing protein [Verrucomicrobiae bacterium]|nr:right-handed parallel beta-helix repeat-containing protein [Verrucomicrobiae bacterium]